jgi:hypothetical protein
MLGEKRKESSSTGIKSTTRDRRGLFWDLGFRK